MLLGPIVPLLLLAKFWFEPLWCRKCPLHIPYPAFAEDIRRAGFERGTIVSHFSRYKNGGILRPFFPDARIIDLKLLALADPPPNIDAGQCLLIWDNVDNASVGEGVIGNDTQPAPGVQGFRRLCHGEDVKRCRIGRATRFDPGFQPGLREHLERAREIQYFDVLEEENADVDLPTGGAFCSVHTDGLAPNRTGVKA